MKISYHFQIDATDPEQLGVLPEVVTALRDAGLELRSGTAGPSVAADSSNLEQKFEALRDDVLAALDLMSGPKLPHSPPDHEPRSNKANKAKKSAKATEEPGRLPLLSELHRMGVKALTYLGDIREAPDLQEYKSPMEELWAFRADNQLYLTAPGLAHAATQLNVKPHDRSSFARLARRLAVHGKDLHAHTFHGHGKLQVAFTPRDYELAVDQLCSPKWGLRSYTQIAKALGWDSDPSAVAVAVADTEEGPAKAKPKRLTNNSSFQDVEKVVEYLGGHVEYPGKSGTVAKLIVRGWSKTHNLKSQHVTRGLFNPLNRMLEAAD